MYGREAYLITKYSEKKENVQYDGSIYEFSKKSGNIDIGKHKISVKFKGDTSAAGEGNRAATVFNNRYGNGYLIFVERIIIEALDVNVQNDQ